MRFNEAMMKERDSIKKPKETKADKEMKEIKREINVNNKVNKLLGSGRSNR